MSYLVITMLWKIINWCCWAFWYFGSDIPIVQVEIRLFEGEPDSMGAYEFTTVSKQWGPK